MLAETFPHIIVLKLTSGSLRTCRRFFYRRPQVYALDLLKIRTLRCSVHTEPPLKVPCEHIAKILNSPV